MKLRLNIDLGELADEPEALVALAQLANVACGAHAGDAHTAARVCRRALRHGVQVGAHPSFPDRENFGRSAMELDDDALRRTIEAQLSWLSAIAKAEGVALAHMKPHGALYHAADRDASVARALVEVTRATLGDVAVIGPPGGALQSAARASSMAFLREGFADRAYRDDGTLVPRGAPGALLADVPAVRAQVERLTREGRFDTLCVHGDGPDAVAVARAVREALG